MPQDLPASSPDILFLLGELDRKIHNGTVRNDSLFMGKLGLSLYNYSYFEHTGSEQHLERGRTLLDEVFQRFNESGSSLLNPSLSTGLGGFMSLLNYLTQKQYIYQDMQEFGEIDKFLFKQALHQIEHDFNDYLHGAFGVLNYFLEREPEPAIQLYIECLVEAIIKRIVVTKEGAWIRNYILSKDETCDVNLSLSHGQTGFILVLLKAFEQGYSYEMLHDHIRGMVSMVVKQTMTTDPEHNRHSIFPNTVNESTREKHYNNRLAWCYGDLNQAYALYKAGSVFGLHQFIEIADLIGASSLDRKDEDATMCVDAQFCHGAAGVAALYQSLYAISGRTCYRKAADKWIEQTLQFLEEDKINLDYKDKELSLLEGLPGIGLVLLDHVYPDKTGWKEFFLIS